MKILKQKQTTKKPNIKQNSKMNELTLDGPSRTKTKIERMITSLIKPRKKLKTRLKTGLFWLLGTEPYSKERIRFLQNLNKPILFV